MIQPCLLLALNLPALSIEPYTLSRNAHCRGWATVLSGKSHGAWLLVHAAERGLRAVVGQRRGDRQQDEERPHSFREPGSQKTINALKSPLITPNIDL